MSKLIKSTAIISFFTLFSRILGMIRDMVLMSVFGTGGMMDAFLVAFKLPNFLRRLFAEGAFAQAFVPVLSDYQHQAQNNDMTDSKKALRHLMVDFTFIDHVSIDHAS
jgi:putative peptidoglycan lipid II flippase